MPIHLWQISHKIQRTILKFTGRYWQRLQQTSRSHIHVLGTLAYCTPNDKALNIQCQIGPPNPSQQCLRSFTYTKMSCVARIMEFLHQQLSQTCRPRNHQLIYMRFRLPVHQTKTMHIPDTKISIITHGLFMYFNHAGI